MELLFCDGTRRTPHNPACAENLAGNFAIPLEGAAPRALHRSITHCLLMRVT